MEKIDYDYILNKCFVRLSQEDCKKVETKIVISEDMLNECVKAYARTLELGIVELSFEEYLGFQVLKGVLMSENKVTPVNYDLLEEHL
jgi:hypothetical protein